MAQTEYFFTPRLRVVMAFLSKPDERRKLPNGKVVGNDKYKIRGYYDPDTEEAKEFHAAGIRFLKEAGVENPKEALRQSLPLAGDTKAPEGIPSNWRRLTASTQFGPVEAVDRSGKDVADPSFYAGVWAIAQVSFFKYEDQKTDEGRLSFRLGPVLLDGPGERLKVGSRPSAKEVFGSRLTGGVSNTDPFAEPDDDIPF